MDADISLTEVIDQIRQWIRQRNWERDNRKERFNQSRQPMDEQDDQIRQVMNQDDQIRQMMEPGQNHFTCACRQQFPRGTVWLQHLDNNQLCAQQVDEANIQSRCTVDRC